MTLHPCNHLEPGDGPMISITSSSPQATQSLLCSGNVWDNAAMESFFSPLK